MRHFCTLFDSRYLLRALVLYRSLERHCAEFRLHALCMDRNTERLLERLELGRLEAIRLDELEAADPRLRAARSTRSFTEYCFTITPVLSKYILEREPGLDEITYLDADLMFFASPEPLFAELGTCSILLVPHRFAPEHYQCESADTTSEEAWGTFNVEFMTFRRDANGLKALDWWRERCIEFCPAMIHPGYFGDQKYLDDWPTRFDGVHVLRHLGGGLAPWNVSQYLLERRGEQILVDEQPLVFHHYQTMWLHWPSAFGRALAGASGRYRQARCAPHWVWSTRWPLSPQVLDLLWDPYVDALTEAWAELTAAGADPKLATVHLSPAVASSRFVKRHLPKKTRRTYWKIRRAARAPAPIHRPASSAAD